MAKLVDATGLGPVGSNAVLVRVQSVAPTLDALNRWGVADSLARPCTRLNDSPPLAVVAVVAV